MNHQELRELAEKATPGPWTYDCGNHQIETTEDRIEICDEVPNNVRVDDVRYRMGDEAANKMVNTLRDSWHDMNFIAAANPSTVIQLLDQLEVVRAYVMELREALKYAHGPEGPYKADKALAMSAPWEEPDPWELSSPPESML